MDYATFMQDPKRERSPEVDFGTQWRNPADPGFTWRVSWIQATGELYAVKLWPKDQEVLVLGRFPTREEVEAFMRGWATGPRYLPPLANPAWFRQNEG